MPDAFAGLSKYTLLLIGALFPIVNPVGNAPLFLTLTHGLSGKRRAVLARMIALNGLALILGSVFIGTYILTFFGMSLPVVQVGGGMVLIATGWNLLCRPDDSPEGSSASKLASDADFAKQAFYPLTLPLTVGPGSISVAITLGANRPNGAEWSSALIAGTVLGSAVIALTIYLSYRFADRLASVLGVTAMNAFIRLSSFILLCIGVQIVWNGVKALLHEVALL